MGVLFLIGALCWAVIDPTRPVFEELPGRAAFEPAVDGALGL
jgi:hypothetical protein